MNTTETEIQSQKACITKMNGTYQPRSINQNQMNPTTPLGLGDITLINNATDLEKQIAPAAPL